MIPREPLCLPSLHGPLAVIDRHGVILAANEAWSRPGSGRTRGSIGANHLEACRLAAADGEPHAGRMGDAIESVLEGRTPRASLEYDAGSPTGQSWFEMIVERRRQPKGGAIVAHLDITRRRRAEEEARYWRDKLAHAHRITTMGELAGSLAHEINQPVTAILANAQAARRLARVPAGDSGDLAEALAVISADAKRAARMIDGLLALFRKRHVTPIPVDLNGLIVAVSALVHHDLRDKDITYRLQLSPSLPAVLADPIQAQQVVLNLFVNAADAVVAADGVRREVTIVTRTTDARSMELVVTDTGVGVPESDLERIFEPFVSTKANGLGLGLSISRSIVEAHGGRMWAARNRQGGLAVHVRLPTIRAEDPPGREGAASRATPRRRASKLLPSESLSIFPSATRYFCQ